MPNTGVTSATTAADRVCIVSGGASGIGLAVSRRLADEGSKVVIFDRALPELADENPRISAWAGDVTDVDSVAALIEHVLVEHGRLDCLVHAAGIALVRPFLETSVEDFRRVVDVNLAGAFIVCQAAAIAMVHGDAIVTIRSVVGIRGSALRCAYGTSKAGLLRLGETMAVELADRGIRVNMVAPGPIESPFASNFVSDAFRAGWNARVPMKRFGTIDEVVGIASFLCSDEASYITGQAIAVDGGFATAGVLP